MHFCPNCGKRRFRNSNFCYGCAFDFNKARTIVNNNQDYNDIDLIKKIKNTNLEDVKKFIDLTAMRSGLKVILDLLIKKDIKKINDLFDKNLLNKLIPDLISQEEIENIVFADLKKVIDKDSYSLNVIEEMQKQHTRTWELLLEGSLFVLKEEFNKKYPRIWYKKFDSCAEDTEKINFIDIDGSSTIKHEGLEEECAFLLLKPKYKELIFLIQEYLSILPDDSKVEETLSGKIKKALKLKIGL